MINVKVVLNQKKELNEDIKTLVYYSCKEKKSNQKYVFILCPKTLEESRELVIWLNSKHGQDRLGWDWFSTLQNDYYNFQEVKDAELTFYV